MTPEQLQEKFDQIATDTITEAQQVDCQPLDYIIGLETIIASLQMEIDASRELAGT